MKQSKYNYILRSKNQAVIVFNTASEAMVSINNELFTKYFTKAVMVLDENATQLHNMGFLVDDNEDETFKQNCIRMTEKYCIDKKITYVTILTTLNCNARCWYCFENGTKRYDMSDDVVNDTIKFLIENGDPNDLEIRWFGGEPLMRKDTIYKISKALLDKGFNINSVITTNGLLFDKAFSQVMKENYGLTRVQITIEGINEDYNNIRKYPDYAGNAFDKVIENIQGAIDNGIKVNVRVNFSPTMKNSADDTIEYLHNRFGNSIYIYVSPVYGTDQEPCKKDGTYLYFLKKLIDYKYIQNLSQCYLRPKTIFCGAQRMNNFAIAPDGKLYKCEHELTVKHAERNVGSVQKGIEYNSIYKFWCEEYEQNLECQECVLLPICQGGCKGARALPEIGEICPPYKPYMKDLLLEMYKIKTKEV